MSTMDPVEYFRRKLDSLNTPKQASITEAMQNKLAGLQEYQLAAAQGKAFQSPDRSATEILQDAAVVAAKGAIGLPEAFVGLADIPTGGAVGKFLEEEAGFRPGETKKMLDGYYSDAQKEANLRVQMADGFIDTLDQATSNPSTIATTVGESLPQMLGGAAVARGLLKAGLKSAVVAGAAGEGIMGAGSAAEQIRQETQDGRLTLKQSLAAAGSGAGTALVGLAGGKLAQKLGVADIDTALASGTLKSPAGFFKTLATSGISEGVFEELPQSAQEQMWQNFATDKPLTEGVGNAAAMGLLAGLAMGQTVGTASALAGLPGSTKTEEQPGTKKAKEEAQAAAISSGDVSALLDRKSPAFDPAQAVAALAGHSAQEGTTEEVKQGNLEKASKIVSDLEVERDALKADLQLTTPEGLASEKAQLEQAKASDNAELAAALEESIKVAEATTPDQARSLSVRLARTEERLAQAQENFSRFTAEKTAAPETDVDALVASISAPIDETDAVVTGTRAKQIDQVINLSMSAPERLSAKSAEALASNPKNGLNEAQRTYLREFSAARVAENTAKNLSKVQQEVFVGGKGYIGLDQHVDRVATAVTANNQGLANRQLAVLRSFSKDHLQKAEVAAQAWEAGQGTQIVKVDGQWQVNTGDRLADPVIRKNGGLTVNTPKLPEAIKAEADAVTATLRQLEAAVALKFPTQSIARNGVAPNVSVTPQAQPAAQDTSVSGQEVQAAETPGTSEGSGDAVSADVGTRTDPVESAGVTTAVEIANEKVAKLSYLGLQAAIERTGAEQAKRQRLLASEEATRAYAEERGISYEDMKQLLEENYSNNVQLLAVYKEAIKTKAKPSTAGISFGVTEVTEAPATTVEVTTPSESSEKTSKDQSTESQGQEPTTGGLTVLKSGDKPAPGSKLSEIYRTMNKALAFLTQKRTKVEKDADIARVRPLVEIDDLLSRWNKKAFEPSDLFVNDELGAGDPEGHRAHALATFQKYATKWSESIAANFIKGSLPNSKGNTKSADQLFRDPVQDLINDAGEVDENLVTAVAYGAYSWLMDALNSPALKKKEDILEMHGMGEDDGQVTAQGWKVLSRVTAFEDSVVNEIGASIVAALGLEANGSAPQSYMPQLRAALGVHALKLLEREGLIELDYINQAKVQEYLGNPGEPETRQYNTYVRIPRDVDTLEPGEQNREIKSASQGASDVVNKFFGVERAPVEATMEPVTFAQKFAKGTQQTITKFQAKILAAANKQEHRIIPAMWSAMQVLGDGVVLRAAGWKEYDEAKIQVSNRESVRAQNENLERQLESMQALVQGAKDPAQPFFVNHEVWRNFRVGISTRNLNPQTSKIHRFMFFRPEWEAKIELNDQAKVDQFLVSVAQALGVKVDQQPNVETLAKLETKLSDPNNRVRELAAAIQKKEVSPEQKEAIAELAAGAEGIQTLQGLVAYGEYLAAMEAGKPDFTVQMLVGVDGKTNGPILSHLALGAAESVDALFGMMNRGGMYRPADGVRSYNHWYKKPSSLDLYEDLSKAILTSLKAGNTAQMQALYMITKPLLDGGKVTSAGRKIVKTPLTSFAFGSTIKKSLENMQAAFVQSVVDRIEDLSTGRDTKTSLADLIQSINVLMKIGDPSLKGIPQSATIEQLMDWEMTPQVEKAFKEAFNELLGGAVNKTMRRYFGVFSTRRNAVNQSVQAGFHMYSVIYQDLRTKELERLMDAGEIAFTESKDGKRTPLHDMTVAQENALRKKVASVLPRAHTAYSQDEGSLASGLLMAKTDRGMSDEPMHKVEVQMGLPFEGAGGQRSTQSMARAMIGTEISPGVAGLPYFMHSTDSRIMHESIEGTDSLNVHDEAGNGPDKVERTANRINGATWSTMLRFSPAKEAYELFERAVLNAAALREQNVLPPETVRSLQAVAEALLPEAETPSLEQALSVAKSKQFEADLLRLQAMTEMAFVDQYTWEGGEYAVTEADRAEAQKLLAEHQAQGVKLSKEAVEAAKALDAPVEVKPEAVEETFQPEGDPVEQTSPFGGLGQPATVDAGLQTFFEKNPNPDIKAVLVQLYKSIKAKGDGRTNLFQLELLKMLNKAVDPSIKVKLVTPGMGASDVLAMPKQPSLGWFVATPDAAELYVLSPGFVNSGLQSTETLLHEVVHAAVSNIVSRRMGESAALVKDLEALMQKASDYATKAAIADKYKEALGDVQEFIAYGMTNVAFQREVLSKISMKSSTGSTTLVTGFKSFIEKLVGILFKGTDKSVQARTVNGLTIMVKNVSGLLNQAEQEQGQARGAATINLSQAVQSMSTLDIHNALDGTGLSDTFNDKLGDLLDGIVQKLHGPFGSFKNDVLQRMQGVVTPEDVWLKAQSTGAAPLTMSVRGSPIQATERELHAMEQVEATVRAALASPEATARVAYKELADLYSEMAEKIKPTDFASRDQYDFIFKIESGADGKSNYLARFAAFALANQEFNRLMQQSSGGKKQSSAPKSFADRIQAIFEKMLGFLSEKLTGTYTGQRADIKLETLVSQLVEIEAKKRDKIARAATSTDFSPDVLVEKMVGGLVKKVKSGAADLADSDTVRNSKNTFVRLAGSLVRLNANDQVEYLYREIGKWRDQQFPGLQGLPTEILNQFRGMGQTLNLLQLMSTNAQRKRKEIIAQTSKAAMLAFKDAGAYLKTLGDGKGKEAKATITQVFMRTGMHVLLDQFNMIELEKLVSSKADLDQAVAEVESDLGNIAGITPYVEHFINHANALGYFRVTGKVKHPRLMMNAHNISRLYGTALVGRLTEAESRAAEPVIAKLVALYGLSYLSRRELDLAGEIMRTEAGRDQATSPGNGVEFVLRIHKKMEQDSKDRLFRNQEALAMHGYTPEIYNPGTVIAIANEEDGKDLEYQGYTKGRKVQIDPADPDKEVRHMYTLKDGGLARFQTGIVSYSGKRAKGTTQHSGYLNVNTADGLENASLNADISAAKPGGLSRGKRPDLGKQAEVYMAPVVNPQGEIVNWRYLMNDDAKNEVLERDGRFDNVLGALAGSIFDKQSTAETNGKTLDALREIYQSQRHTEPASFVLVGPKSTDSKLREIWSMLPGDTKALARTQFGKDGMYVRKDMLLPVFGYRQYSLSEAFRADPDSRNAAEKVMVEVVETALTVLTMMNHKGATMTPEEARKFAKRAAVYVTRFEKGWQEIVHEVKDIIVVKSIKVLVDNVMSNWSQLALAGVPIRDILRHHLVALRAARTYEADSGALDQLQLKIDAGMAPPNAARELARLKDALVRNPVKDMIDAGLMPTIVEDVAADDDVDSYSYKSQLARKAAKFTEKVNPVVMDAAKGVYMAHDTKLYQGLSRLTRLSDFVARYTLYQHLIAQKDAEGNPTNKEDAINEASEAFVNYDSPLPKPLQYLDSMGIVPFTKYYLRIQRVIMRLVRDNPGKVLATLLIDNFVNLGPIVLDSSWIHRIGNNPLQWGAFQLPGTVDELGTVAAATALLK